MEITTRMELNFSKRKECFIRLDTQAPCEDAHLFAEIFLYCCQARTSLRSGGKQNTRILLDLMNLGPDLDRYLLEHVNEFYKLADHEVPEVHKSLNVKLWFDLVKMEKYKYDMKPLVVWKENLWEESVVLLQRFLIRRHRDDQDFLAKLSKAISLTNQAVEARMLWRPSYPMRIAYNAARDYVFGMFRLHFKEAGLSDEEIDNRIAMAEFEEELDSASTDEEIMAAADKALEATKSPQDD